MRNNKNSIGENVILFLVAIGVFAIIGGFAGCWSGSDDEEYYDYDYSPSSSYSSDSSSSYPDVLTGHEYKDIRPYKPAIHFCS